MESELAQHGRGVSLVDDQKTVEEFATDGANKASAIAFARGARTGALAIWILMAANTASKAAANLPADYRHRVALAVCLLFDRRSERAVRALWDRLERVGVPSLRSHTHGRHVPHVSYVVLRSWDLAEVSAALLGVGGLPPVELSFDGVGLFRRGRAWLLAGGSVELHARQERIVEAITATGAELHQHYRPGRWLPHCSVAPRAPLTKLPVLAAAVYDVLPLDARLDRLALIDSATGELWPVER